MAALNYLIKLSFLVCTALQLVVGKSSSLDKECRNVEYEVKLQKNSTLLNHVIDNVTVTSETMCRINCFIKPGCVSYNLGPAPSPDMLLCELNNVVRHQYPHDYRGKPGFSHRGVVENKCAAAPCQNNGTCYHGYGADRYLCTCRPGFIGKNCENDATHVQLGKSEINPAKNCSHLKQELPSLPSGAYWINLGDPDKAFLAYCEMVTDGGGWTLVWAYTFRFYKVQFTSFSNAVTPGPANLGQGVISNTPPINETDYNAIDFTKWKLIGSEILIKSNINNWLACEAKTGSFVTKTAGFMDCRMIRQITPTCSVVPNYFGCTSYGCYLKLSKFMYYWVTNPSQHWPTHDPCSANQANHLKNIQNPHGDIFVR